MIPTLARPPWPDGVFVLDLDALPADTALGDVLALERRPRPVVGVVTGHCDGVRMAAASSVTLLVADPAATFHASGPGTDIAVRRLRGLVGRRVAMYLCVRQVGAPDGLRWGLVNRVSEAAHDTAAALGRELAERAPEAVAAIMTQLGWDAPHDHAHGFLGERLLAARAAHPSTALTDSRKMS